MRLRLAFLTVFAIAACGLGYQLIAGSVSSYLLGDSITQFSFTIGLYLFGLGVGSWLSKYVEEGLATRFVQLELAVALIGGFSALLLMMAFASELWFRPVLYGVILLVGTLVGVEIPLLLRLLKDQLEFKELVAKVLTFDYVGALVVAIVFPVVLVPTLGLVRTALWLGVLNAGVGLWSIALFREQLKSAVGLQLQAGVVFVLLAGGIAVSEELSSLTEHQLYANEIVYAKSTPYQRVVVTRTHRDFQLFLNGGLQFNSDDEYRYHEALVHPVMGSVDEPRRVLVLGGGDGLAVREVLRHDTVERVTLVDLDPAVTELARDMPQWAALNEGALDDPRVEVINDDAMNWLVTDGGTYDVAIVDFPDPHSFSLGKLYSHTFYRRLWARIAPDGAIAIQSTNPRQAPQSYWCIARTLESAEWFVRPYRCGVPSFGEWGFMLAAKRKIPVPARLPADCRFLNDEFLPTLFVLPEDVQAREVEPNYLNTQALVRYYEREVAL